MATNVPNPGAYLDNLGVLLTAVRDTFVKLDDARAYIASMGGEAFLTAAIPDGLGMTQADADALIATLDQHHDLSVGYTGGPPAPQLDYKDNGSRFWGGR
jgi:hypothetical protein